MSVAGQESSSRGTHTRMMKFEEAQDNTVLSWTGFRELLVPMMVIDGEGCNANALCSFCTFFSQLPKLCCLSPYFVTFFVHKSGKIGGLPRCVALGGRHRNRGVLLLLLLR